MLTIWGHAGSSNVAKVMWAVGELGIAHRRHDAGGRFGITAAYRALNPNGRIPTIEDDDFVLWESNAVVRYLAAKHGALCPDHPRARADADRWMDWSGTTLAGAIAGLREAYKAPEDRRDAARIAAATETAGAVVGILDRVLAGRPHVAGDTFSTGDIALGPLVHRWCIAPVDKPRTPMVADWYERMKRRPAFMAHVVDAVR